MVTTDELIPYMRRVQAVEREMGELGLLWQMIESSAAISCPHDVVTILPTLVQTRARFDELRLRLVHALAAANLAQLQDELAARAQCAIDILIRNLFERTADVGFLATDDVIRAFCSAQAEQRAELVPQLRRRLGEYRAKYTVYDDVVVLDAAGNVLVRLDQAASLTTSSDAIVPAALAARGYVERFGSSDLAAGARPALLYGHRIDGEHGRALGVLVLRFRFEDEMRRIFDSVADPHQQYALALLDGENRVLASNDPGHVPLDVALAATAASGVDLVCFSGREYLATSCATQGYQSYHGPGWRAHAMVSLLTGFRIRSDDASDCAVTLDNADLQELQREAEAINRNLRRVVWNGRLMAGSSAGSGFAGGAVGGAASGDAARLKAVLTQVNQAGTRTSERVRQAVAGLHAATLERICRQTAELARLAADIMDRNLYERANDCRWWALSPVLRRALSSPESESATRALAEQLDYINSLYTVYRRLVAFDAAGVIRGVTHDDPAAPLLGSGVDPALLQAARALSKSQHYAVTPFAPSALSDGEPSYVYFAAVRDEQEQFAGGIAIVFHSLREFGAMLRDVLGERDGFAAFVDARGAVLASTSAEHVPGALLPIDKADRADKADSADSADGAARITVIGQEQFATARVRAAGYREFKTADGYDNQVSAVVALRLGPLEQRASEAAPAAVAAPAVDRSHVIEVAVVQVGGAHYALAADRVISAIAPTRIVQTPNALAHWLGLMQVEIADARSVIPVLSGRSLFGATQPERPGDGIAVVLRQSEEDQPALGLWVDDVAAVVEIQRSALQESPAVVRTHSPLVSAVFNGDVVGAPGLVQLIDADRLEQLIGRAARTARWDVGQDNPSADHPSRAARASSVG